MQMFVLDNPVLIMPSPYHYYTRRHTYRVPCASPSPRCVPCADLSRIFLFAFIVLLCPCLLKMGLFLLATHAIWSLLFCLGARAAANMRNGCCMKEAGSVRKAGWCGATCATKMPAASGSTPGAWGTTKSADGSRDTENAACATKNGSTTVREELAKETAAAARRHHDLSSVRVDERSDETEEIQVVVAVPGVRSADLSVSVLDGVLRVTGKTTKGADVFRVDRRIALPRSADVETMRATHADGTVEIVMRRKASIRIPLVQRQQGDVKPAEQQHAEELDAADATEAAARADDVDEAADAGMKSTDGSDNEWEPLTADKEESSSES